MASLEIVAGHNAGQIHQLIRYESVIGRHPTCEIVLPESQVSRKHIRLLEESDGYYIEDLNSQNGTFLNGKRIDSRSLLADGDQIHIEGILILFHDPDRPRTGAAAEGSNDAVDDFLLADDEVLEHSSTILTVVDVEKSTHRKTKGNAAVKLDAMLEISKSLGSSLDMNQVLPTIMDSIFRIFPQAERGYILLADGPNGKLIPRVIKPDDDSDDSSAGRRSISRTITQKVMSDGQAILSADASHDDRFKASESVMNLGIRSVMCVPLMAPSSPPLGIIQIETQDLSERFVPEDLEVLVNVAILAGQAVENAKLHATQLQLERHGHKLATAREVQMRLLPRKRPDVPRYSFFDYYNAVDEIGGDYYGYIELPGERLAIALGDVAGHGVSAALLMAQFCAEVRYRLVTNSTPAEAVKQLNRHLSTEVLDGRFITFALCVLDPNKDEIVVVNAGHVPPLLRSSETGQIELLGVDTGGTPLGFEPNQTYLQLNVQLKPGDAVLVYTDGISEAVNSNKELYGNQRLREVMAATSGDAEQTGEAILNDVRLFRQGTSQRDDVCLVSFALEP